MSITDTLTREFVDILFLVSNGSTLMTSCLSVWLLQTLNVTKSNRAREVNDHE